jgi:hypothetical protein
MPRRAGYRSPPAVTPVARASQTRAPNTSPPVPAIPFANTASTHTHSPSRTSASSFVVIAPSAVLQTVGAWTAPQLVRCLTESAPRCEPSTPKIIPPAQQHHRRSEAQNRLPHSPLLPVRRGSALDANRARWPSSPPARGVRACHDEPRSRVAVSCRRRGAARAGG